MPAAHRSLFVFAAMFMSLALLRADEKPHSPQPSEEKKLDRGAPRQEPARSIPFLSFKWCMPALESEPSSPARAVDDALKSLENRKQPPLTAFHPITAVSFDNRRRQNVPLVVCRSYGGILAIDARRGALMWRQPTTWSLESLLSTDNPDGGAARSQAVSSWLQFYRKEGRPEVVFENSVLGTLSADSNFVYGVDDLTVPPPPYLFDKGHYFGDPERERGDEEMSKAVGRSRLYACNLARGGALEWRLGEEGDELAGSIFLGPPLPLDGKIYLLVEKQQEIRLVCVDPTAPDTRPRKVAGRRMARILWMQTLERVPEKLRHDVTRRMTALPLACAEGVLVCPTHLGSIIGVDLLRKRQMWKYTYSEGEKPRDKKPAAGGWKWLLPVISDGKVVFTSPDTRELHCLSLREGTRLWSVPRQEGDLYLAGVKDGKVLVVRKRGLRALRLASGRLLWTLTAGRPSGQGILVGDDYYLPVQEHASSQKPGLAIIDLAAGRLRAFVPMQKRKESEEREVLEAPGNLLFTQGLLFSQTPRNLFAYPQAAK